MKSSSLTLFAICLACFLACTNAIPRETAKSPPAAGDATNISANVGASQGEAMAVKAGHYGFGHPDRDAAEDFLGRSTVAVWLSWHNGISFNSDDNLNLDQLRNRLKETEDKTQASIILQKNYNSESNEDAAVADLLKELGFETIVVQSCHSSATVIERIIRNTK